MPMKPGPVKRTVVPEETRRPTYSEQQRTKEWLLRRAMILVRDEFKCRTCGGQGKFLNVHHLCYSDDRLIHQYPDDALQTLCNECHDKTHAKRTIKDFYIRDFKRYDLPRELVDVFDKYCRPVVKYDGGAIGVTYRMKVGKYKGMLFKDVPDNNYRTWYYTNVYLPEKAARAPKPYSAVKSWMVACR